MKKQDARPGVRSFVLAYVLGALTVFAGCASTFVYKYYGLDGVSYKEGKLLGPKPEFDRSFSECQPEEAVDPNTGEKKFKHKCAVMFIPEVIAWRKDYESCKIDLIDCQKARNQQ